MAKEPSHSQIIDRLARLEGTVEENFKHTDRRFDRIEQMMHDSTTANSGAFVRGSDRMREIETRLNKGDLSRLKQWVAIILVATASGASGGPLLNKLISFVLS